MSDETQPPQGQPPAATPVPKAPSYPGIDDAAAGIALRPRNFEELWNFSKMVAETDFVPMAFRGKPGAVIAACQLGNEVGLPPMTALKWIAVINGTPSIWGDGYWMLLRSHPLCEYAEELSPDEALKAGYGECTIKRKGAAPVTRRYTKAMAETAGLWGGKGSTEEKRKYSPWFTNPGRMLQMRARALAGRDAIPEATGPLSMREEAEDFARDITPAQPEPKPRPQMPQPTATTKGESLETGNDRATADVGENKPRVVENPPAIFEGNPPSGEVDSEKGGQEGRPAKEGTTQALPPSYQERRAWIETASLEELQHNKNFALANMKNLTQAEQASICTMINDKKQALLKAQE